MHENIKELSILIKEQCLVSSSINDNLFVKAAARGGTPIHYLYGYVPPNGGRDFEAPDLERGIHFRGVF